MRKGVGKEAEVEEETVQEEKRDDAEKRYKGRRRLETRKKLGGGELSSCEFPPWRGINKRRQFLGEAKLLGTRTRLLARLCLPDRLFPITEFTQQRPYLLASAKDTCL